MPNDSSVKALAKEISACRICVDAPQGKPLPHEPRPVVILSDVARIAIVGQAPGMRVHQSGIPFSDPSGRRLRQWMGVDEAIFYDRSKVAIVPMGFCFPGYDKNGGDLPPRKECAATWHYRAVSCLKSVDLWLIAGLYSQKQLLGNKCLKTLTETVHNWKIISQPENGVRKFPLPHPSWRNNGWLRNNPWFETELLPELKWEISKRI